MFMSLLAPQVRSGACPGAPQNPSVLIQVLTPGAGCLLSEGCFLVPQLVEGEAPSQSTRLAPPEPLESFEPGGFSARLRHLLRGLIRAARESTVWAAQSPASRLLRASSCLAPDFVIGGGNLLRFPCICSAPRSSSSHACGGCGVFVHDGCIPVPLRCSPAGSDPAAPGPLLPGAIGTPLTATGALAAGCFGKVPRFCLTAMGTNPSRSTVCALRCQNIPLPAPSPTPPAEPSPRAKGLISR